MPSSPHFPWCHFACPPHHTPLGALSHALLTTLPLVPRVTGLDAARTLTNALLCQLPSAPPLEALQRAVETLTTGNGLVGGNGAWMCAEIPRTKLHVTMVPPPSAFGRARAGEGGREGGRESGQEVELDRERAAALRRLNPYVGQRVCVRLLRYHRAVVAGGGEATPTLTRGKGRGGLPMPERQVGFWEVGALVGPPEELQYAPQAEAYHITDTASLIGCAPKEANEVLRALRRGDLGAEWEAQVLPAVDDLESGQAAPKEMWGQVRVI